MPAATHKSFIITDVEDLGKTLVRVADLYPLTFLTERDFFPLVVAYLTGRVPGIDTEVGRDEGVIDFRIGGTNPAALELAVAPRAFNDPNNPSQQVPGHKAKTQLYASANKDELKKLHAIPKTQAKNRYLLLLDLCGSHDLKSLKASYEQHLPKDGSGSAVRVVYVSRTVMGHFQAGGQKKGPKTAQSGQDNN